MKSNNLAQLKEWVPGLEEALNQAMSNHLQLTQGKLVKANPKDTGRMASSWVIGHNRVNTETRAKDWAPQGAKKVVVDEYPGKITADGTWYLSNSVQYANKVAYDPTYAKGGAGGPAWYTTIVNQLQPNFEKQLVRQLRKVKL